MNIGLAYDLKEKVPVGQTQPEDALEEYDSRETIEGIAAVLTAQGHSVIRLDGGRDFLTAILHESVDLVFNIAEGLGNYRSREAQVPGVLEMLDIPYTGSDPQCLAICLDKPLTKQLVALAGVSTPRWQVIEDGGQLSKIDWSDFPFPAFLKPVHEGSSKGVRFASKVDSAREIARTAQNLLEHYQQPVMVEEFITGDEVTVGVIGNSPPKILGIMRVLPKTNEGNFIYSLEVKRDWEKLVDYECPARLEASIMKRLADASLKTFEVLGCRDFARVDFRLSRDETPNFLEINPLPGLNPHISDLVILAGKIGWTYEALISAVLEAALERYPQCTRK